MAYSVTEIEKCFDLICKKITKGQALRTILKDADMPSSSTFYIWLDSDEIKSKQLKEVFKSEEYSEKCKHNKKGCKSKGVNDFRNKNASITNRKRFPNSELYILKIEGQDLYKIGVSQNISRRLKDISNAMPYVVSLLYLFKINNAYDLENYLHNLFITKHLKNEWFSLNNNDLNECLKEVYKWK